MHLTNTACKNAQPGSKPRKISDGGGLYLEVAPTGGKYWRLKYRFAGKEKRLALGVYPEVSLLEAREKRDAARKLVAAGQDSSQAKREAKQLAVLNSETNFEAIAREWYDKRKHEWMTNYAESMLLRMERHVFPKLGNRPIADISAPELLSVLKLIEKSGALDLAQRMLQGCRQVFTYAIQTGRGKNNPAAEMRGALKSPVHNHHAYLSFQT